MLRSPARVRLSLTGRISPRQLLFVPQESILCRCRVCCHGVQRTIAHCKKNILQQPAIAFMSKGSDWLVVALERIRVRGEDGATTNTNSKSPHPLYSGAKQTKPLYALRARYANRGAH